MGNLRVEVGQGCLALVLDNEPKIVEKHADGTEQILLWPKAKEKAVKLQALRKLYRRIRRKRITDHSLRYLVGAGGRLRNYGFALFTRSLAIRRYQENPYVVETAVMRRDRASGKVGVFLHQGDLVALTPVFDGLLCLYAWLNDNTLN